MSFALQPFSARQLEVIRAPTGRYVLLADGAVRSGKTIACTVRWLAYLGSLPRGTKVLMTGRTRESLRNNILDDLFKIVGPRNYTYNYQRGELVICGRRCRCVGANDEKSKDVIQGDTYAGWYGDEVVLYPQSFIDQARARCSLDPGMVLWTCNPDGPFHPIHQDFIDPEAPAVRADLVRRVHFELGDNLTLSESYRRMLEASYTGLFYKRYILGLWVLAEGVIYDGLDLAKQGFDDEQAPQVFDSLAVAVDYGTQNPFHALLVGVKGDVSWVLDEWRYCGQERERQHTDGEYSAELRTWLGRRTPAQVIVDPSATSFIVQLKRDGWGGVTLAENDVVPGIRTVANRLAAGKLRIHRTRGPHLVKELGSYAWDPKAARRGEDAPLKVNDHGPDALRYHEFTRFGQMRPGITTIQQMRGMA